LEKARQFGGHIVSGAICNLQVIAKLFPDFESQGFPHEGRVEANHLSVLGSQQRWDLPEAVIPPGFRKQGQFILTLSHVIRWLAETLQEKAKGIPNVTLDVFPGFAAHEILYEGERVIGVRASDSGQVYEDCIFAELTCFGDKGFISKDLIEKFQLRPNPQLWSVGVKEVWQIPQSLQGQVWHTLGYPVLDGSFSGGFVYGLKDNRLALGLIIGLDSKNPNLNPQQRLQEFKAHPWIQSLIAGGRLLKYGAAVIPEGGYHSLPTRFGVEGALLLGDALGVLDVGSLAGVDNAMETGYLAAGLIHDGFLKGDLRIQADYQRAVMESAVGQNLYRSRYFREAFLENSRLLEEYLPQVCRSVDAGHPWLGSLRWGFTGSRSPRTRNPARLHPAHRAGQPQRATPARLCGPPRCHSSGFCGPHNLGPPGIGLSTGLFLAARCGFFRGSPLPPKATVISWSSTPKPAAGASPPTTS
jgi:electron-transferring-flavoprotein dehydrogenase